MLEAACEVDPEWIVGTLFVSACVRSHYGGHNKKTCTYSFTPYYMHACEHTYIDAYVYIYIYTYRYMYMYLCRAVEEKPIII